MGLLACLILLCRRKPALPAFFRWITSNIALGSRGAIDVQYHEVWLRMEEGGGRWW